jgi:hypothetical protein
VAFLGSFDFWVNLLPITYLPTYLLYFVWKLLVQIKKVVFFFVDSGVGVLIIV